MRILLLVIVIFCTSLSVVKKKLWLCSTIIKKPGETIHAPRVVSAKDFNEARKKYLHHLMNDCKGLEGGEIDTREKCLAIEEINESIIIE